MDYKQAPAQHEEDVPGNSEPLRYYGTMASSTAAVTKGQTDIGELQESDTESLYFEADGTGTARDSTTQATVTTTNGTRLDKVFNWWREALEQRLSNEQRETLLDNLHSATAPDSARGSTSRTMEYRRPIVAPATTAQQTAPRPISATHNRSSQIPSQGRGPQSGSDREFTECMAGIGAIALAAIVGTLSTGICCPGLILGPGLECLVHVGQNCGCCCCA